MTFVEVWFGYAILGTLGFCLTFVWAVRNRQFTDFERGRRIVLGDVPEETAESRVRTCRADRILLISLIVITLAAMVAAAVVGFVNR